MKRTAVLLVPFALCLFAAAASAQPTLTYVDLVNRMIDLEHLAVLPAGARPVTSGRATTAPASTTRRPASTSRWDANGDGNGIIRREGEQEVMAEMEGPGCIWRIWSARPRRDT